MWRKVLASEMLKNGGAIRFYALHLGKGVRDDKLLTAKQHSGTA